MNTPFFFAIMPSSKDVAFLTPMSNAFFAKLSARSLYVLPEMAFYYYKMYINLSWGTIFRQVFIVLYKSDFVNIHCSLS
jgi:methionyl-tRNA formyltransferase